MSKNILSPFLKVPPIESKKRYERDILIVPQVNDFIVADMSLKHTQVTIQRGMSDLWQASIVSNFLRELPCLWLVGQHQIIRFRNVHTIVELLQYTRVRPTHCTYPDCSRSR